MADREPISGPDNAWRRMGTWNNLMSITGVMSFDGHVGYEELCERLEERLLRFDRFSQRIVGRSGPRPPYWERIEDFDVRSQVYEVSLPEPRDKTAFQEFVGSLMSRPLDERQPLWEIYLLEDAGSGAGNAIVFRLNHSIGDGFALLYVLLGLIDDPEGLEFPVGGISAPPPPGETTADGGSGPRRSPKRRVDVPGPVETARRVASGLRTAGQAAKVGYDLLTAPDEPATPLLGDLGLEKRVAWTGRLDLDRVKAIGKPHDATVNDVLLAATAGALRTHLQERGADPDGLVLRCTMPVNLKPMEQRTTSLGNYFGLAFVPLPVGTDDVGRRIRYIREHTSTRRLGIEAYLMFLTLSAFGRAPYALQRRVMRLFERQATGVVTNVPGPLDTVQILGNDVEDIMFWVPQANDQGLGISIFSYDGGVRVGIAGDANLVPDPESITGAFEAEVETLAAKLD